MNVAVRRRRHRASQEPAKEEHVFGRIVYPQDAGRAARARKRPHRKRHVWVVVPNHDCFEKRKLAEVSDDEPDVVCPFPVQDDGGRVALLVKDVFFVLLLPDPRFRLACRVEYREVTIEVALGVMGRD